MSVALTAATLNLAVALGCGALIGVERTMRQRKAGLRTNALVALGSAAFVLFSMVMPGDMSPSRVGAQVVSGIGFLGAGIIFRDGFNVHGLTTAATLWCAAAVGVLAGAGHWDLAAVTTGMVVFVNLGLRPLVQWLKRRAGGALEQRQYRVTVQIDPALEGVARALVLRALAVGELQLVEVASRPVAEGRIELVALANGHGEAELQLEQAAQRIAAEPGIQRVAWAAVDDG